MSFSRARTDRPDSLLFRAPTSPRDDPTFPSYPAPLSPLRNLALRVAPTLQDSSDARGVLQRRFTTNALPTLAPIGEQRRQALEQKENGALQHVSRLFVSPAGTTWHQQAIPRGNLRKEIGLPEGGVKHWKNITLSCRDLLCSPERRRQRLATTGAVARRRRLLRFCPDA